VQVVSVCDIDRSKAESRATEFGIERVYDDPEALFAAAASK
jgi:D-apiose dehydrogenase